jgi:adenine/guanine phosphoribosyltransferase-like PRPP-binding protein
MTEPWSGQWVADCLGLRIHADASAGGVRELVGVALRRNQRRPHLLVSTVLGKHVPTDPRIVYAAAWRLGELVAERLDARAVVLGYAETATALGHVVADALGADYLHSTRRAVAGVSPIGGFEEEHSHATRHLLLPDDPMLLARPGPLVLVDDELSTGRTAVNTIAALQAAQPRDRYVVAALVDLRSADDRTWLAARAAELGTHIEVVALASGGVAVPAGFATRAAGVIAEHPVIAQRACGSAPALHSGGWPAGVRDGGRHGFGSSDRVAARAAAYACAAELAAQVVGERVLVLGFEELMYAPLLIACDLAELLGRSRTVAFSSTTRSPVVAIDEPGYPIRTGVAFPSHDDPSDGPGERYAYNIAAAHDALGFTDVVLVIDDVADTAELHADDGLLALLAGTGAQVHLLVVPSYQPAPALSVTP